MLTIGWLNQEWTLLPQKALHWPTQRTVIVADVHFGKPAAFRTLGVPVPEATTVRDLTRLTAIIHATRCERLVFLGDLIHARHGRPAETLATIAGWRRTHRSLDITLVRGNHDRAAGDPPDDWSIQCVNEPLVLAGIELRHAPVESNAGVTRPTIAGHVHPSVRLRSSDGSSIRAACFVFGERSALLPAFGSFTGTHMVRPRVGNRVFAVGQGELVEVSAVVAA